jgi:ribokinase
MAGKILNFGSLNIDYVYHVDNFVIPGETKLATSLSKFGGGKGNNQSIALARAGAKVYHAGNIGQDGVFLIEELKKEGVNTNFINISSTLPTGHAIIQVNTQGENCILLCGGANQEISKTYIKEVLDNFDAGDILLIQNEISNLDTLIELAGAKQMLIYFNPAPMETKVLNYNLDLIDTFIVNQTEAATLTQSNDLDDMLIKMAQLFPKSKIILTLGQDGAIYQYKNQQIRQPGYKATAVDTTAAGDTFIGYFIATCLQQNVSVQSALETACHAAAIAVTRKGATASIPYSNELQIKTNMVSSKS